MDPEKKQKVTVVVTVVVLLFLAWQVYQLFFSESSSSSTPTTSSFQSSGAGRTQVVTKVVQDVKTIPELTPDNLNDEENTLAQKQKVEYLALISEYQLAKIKQMVTETQSAVLDAQLKVIGNQNAQAILRQSGSPTLQGIDIKAFISGAAKSEDPMTYEVVFITKQNKSWLAVLRKGGLAIPVSVNTVLVGNIRVKSIYPNGVTLEDPKNRKRRFIPFEDSFEVSGTVQESPKIMTAAVSASTVTGQGASIVVPSPAEQVTSPPQKQGLVPTTPNMTPALQQQAQ